VIARQLEIETRPLGTAAGRSIPRVALGCGNFGGIGSALDWVGHGMSDDDAIALMDAAWELGITHFDTADAYGAGRSERAIGRWIASRGVRPSLTTKTYNPMAEGADHGLAPERIERQLEASFERLGVDSVELYLAHEYDPDVPVAETLATFEQLQEAGKIGDYGLSNFDAPQLAEALAHGAPVALQNSYSLLDRTDEADVLPLCAAHDVAYLVFGPLYGGWLTGKYRRDQAYPRGSRMTQRPEPYEHLAQRPETFDALDALKAFATEKGTSMAGVAIAWLLAQEAVTQVVIGPGRPEHLEPLQQALEQPLTTAERDQLGAIFQR
jgi:aryl-alcohol dehydrogenase-like predicted oxidoreductase